MLVREAEAAIRIALCDVTELSDEAFVESRDYLREGDCVLSHTWSDVETFRYHRAEIARLTLALSNSATESQPHLTRNGNSAHGLNEGGSTSV